MVCVVGVMDEEPAFGPWRVVRLARFVDLVHETVGAPSGRAPVLAIDGLSASGKTTLARRLQQAIPGAATVHTDDVAWCQSCFDWVALLTEGVLDPLRLGRSVAYRPPAWEQRDRPGAITVPEAARLVMVEGVGAGRRELADHVDGIVWVHADRDATRRRDAARIAVGEGSADTYAAWMREEVPFLAEQRPWERAFAVVAGSPRLRCDAGTVVLGNPPSPPAGSTSDVRGDG